MTSPELDVTVKRLRDLLQRYGEAVPGLWSTIDHVRWQSSTKWASWCYSPIEVVRALLVTAAENSGFRDPKPLLTDLVAVAMLAAWRTTQGIYVFDSDVRRDIWNTPVSGDIPSEVLFHLPEWCCFVSAPGRVFDEEVLGFLVSLNSDSELLAPELWLLVIYKEEDVDVEPLCLTLVGSIRDAIAGGLAKLERTTLATSPQQKDAALLRLNVRYVSHIQDLEGMVSLALYLASENREISNPLRQEPQNPAPKSTKSGPRVFPPPAPKMWDVGFRLGAALRASRECQERNESRTTIDRSSPRGHIRRAHWHSFWSGSRGSEGRVLRAKWLPPIAVNLAEVEDLPAIIHNVERREP
jgi:hypothetical protein